VGLLDSIKKMFGGGSEAPASGDRGVYYFVRCDRCREALKFRVDPLWDLGAADGGGYVVTKHIIGQKCFKTVEVVLTFDDRRVESERQIYGGTFITPEEYEQATALKTTTES
jgi:hypothetical protein